MKQFGKWNWNDNYILCFLGLALASFVSFVALLFEETNDPHQWLGGAVELSRNAQLILLPILGVAFLIVAIAFIRKDNKEKKTSQQNAQVDP